MVSVASNAVIFDIDGVIADTREAVADAYREAGVIMPDEAWGHPWPVWLPALVGEEEAPRIHRKKTVAYTRLLASGAAHPLAGAEVALWLLDRDVDVGFVTGASHWAARGVLRAVGIDPDLVFATECSIDDKVIALQHFAPTGGVYVDDDELLGPRIAERSGWNLIRFVNEVGRLTEDILKWMQ